MALHWPLGGEEEALVRGSLFRKARKGDKKAKRELQDTYGVRLFSEQERATLVYSTPQRKADVGNKKLAQRDQ